MEWPDSIIISVSNWKLKWAYFPSLAKLVGLQGTQKERYATFYVGAYSNWLASHSVPG